MDSSRSLILDLLDQSFDRPAWHGPNLRAATRGLSADEALWRPAPDRNCAWDIVAHCAYWATRVHRRIDPTSARPFPRPGKNWPGPPGETSDATWHEELAFLKQARAALREAVLAINPDDLERPGPNQKRTRREHLVGLALHDVYHAGQIRHLRVLAEAAGGRSQRS